MRGFAVVLAAAAVALAAAAPATKPMLGEPANGHLLDSWAPDATMQPGYFYTYSFQGDYAVTTVAFNITPTFYQGVDGSLTFHLSTASDCATDPSTGYRNTAFTGSIPAVQHTDLSYGPDANTFGVPYADVCHSGIQPQTGKGAGPICLYVQCANSAADCYFSGSIAFYTSDVKAQYGQAPLGNNASAYDADFAPANTACGYSAVDEGIVSPLHQTSTNTICCPNAVLAVPQAGGAVAKTNLRSTRPAAAATTPALKHTAQGPAAAGEQSSKKPSKQ